MFLVGAVREPPCEMPNHLDGIVVMSTVRVGLKPAPTNNHSYRLKIIPLVGAPLVGAQDVTQRTIDNRATTRVAPTMNGLDVATQAVTGFPIKPFGNDKCNFASARGIAHLLLITSSVSKRPNSRLKFFDIDGEDMGHF